MPEGVGGIPKGVGVDIVSVQRISEALERTPGFAEKILTTNELQQLRAKTPALHASFVAKRFALKEAVVKALGTGISKGVSWHQIEVSNNEAGAPSAELSGMALEKLHSLGASQCMVSISDEKESAIAFVILV